MTADERASILIVDDRPEQRLVLQTILEDLGQDLLTAASGEEALKRVLEREFAVILLDVNMPGMDGMETATLIRSRKKSAHVPIIFVTADYNDEPHSARAYSLGAVDYIGSPVVPGVLRSKVKVFVDLYLYAQRERQRVEAQMALVEERAARAAAERAERRAAFLVQASSALVGSLDLEATMHHLATLVVPSLCDVAILHLASDEDHDTRTLMASCHGNAAAVAMSVDAIDEPWLAATLERVRHSGRALTVNSRGRDGLDALRGDVERLQRDAPIALPLGRSAASLAMLPLAARGRSLGVLTLALASDARRFDSDTLSTAADLAARASIALDNAVLFRQVQEGDRRKNEFLAMLAHELRNPLAPISNAVHVLEAAASGPEQHRWARDVIRRQLNQLVRLVDDLLDVSRITRGKIDLRLESVDVARVVEVAVETYRAQLDAMGHVLTVSGPPAPLRFRGDPARTAQILGNLLSNAAKYTDPGGHIWLSAAREDGDVVLRVRDTGVGIPKESLSGIFELFTQLNRTLDRSSGGLGIGLTVVRRLVEMQGGTVTAYSEGPDHGSEFVVRFPAIDVSLPVGESMPPVRTDGAVLRTHAPSQRLSVLVVDDNRDVAESTATLLEMAGHDVHIAYDGASALEAASRVRPQVMLVDIGLPGMDGYEVARRLRADPANRDGWIFALSGYDSEQDRERSASAGFDRHFAKPLDAGQLAGALEALPPRKALGQSGASPDAPRTDQAA
jgi:signal transduction histidine kinase/DNA-binding response OmpR family regulator